MSSDAGLAAYAFEQLDAPAVGAGGVDDVLAAAWAEADRLREEARALGEAEGQAAGLEAAQRQAEPLLAALGDAVEGVHALRAELSETLEREAVELALAIAERIVAGALEAQPERVVDVVRGALRRLAERQRVTVLVNPEDLALVSESAARLRSELGGLEHCEIQADRRVGRGGAVVRTVEGEIDARVETQLERARELVTEELSASPPGEPQ